MTKNPLMAEPFYTNPCSEVMEDHARHVIVHQYVACVRVSNQWAVPSDGESVWLDIPALVDIQVGSCLWNATFGYFRVVSFDKEANRAAVQRNTNSFNAAPGTNVPSCTKFVLAPDIGTTVDATPTIDQVQKGSLITAPLQSTGSDNAQTIALVPEITTTSAGQKFTFVPGFSNTGPTTFNAGTGDLPVTYKGRPLMGGEIVAGLITSVTKTSTGYELESAAEAAVNWIPDSVVGDGTLVIGSYSVDVARFINHGTYIYVELIVGSIVVSSGSDLVVKVALPDGFVPAFNSAIFGQINNGSGWRQGWGTIGPDYIACQDPALTNWSVGSGRSFFATGRINRA